MRFITEFELAEGNINNAHLSIEARKDSEMKIGFEIGNAFGWENPVNGNALRHKISIEAFPMDKWVEFKRDLFAFLDLDSLQYKTLLDRVSELESFGKPSGDTITNQQLNK